MFDYGDKVIYTVKGTIGSVIGFMRSRVTKERDEYLIKFDNNDPEMWLKGSVLEVVEDGQTEGD